MKNWFVCLFAVAGGCSADDGGAGGGLVRITAPHASSAVIAYRDGDGPWMVKMGADAPISFAARSGLYTVAITCPLDTSRAVKLVQLTTDELSELEYGYDCAPLDADLSVTLVGDLTQIRYAWGQGPVAGDGTDSMHRLRVASGTHDFIGRHGTIVPDRLLLVRDVAVPPDPHITVDFGAQETIALATQPITVAGTLNVTFVSAGGTALSLGTSTNFATFVPASALADGDRHIFFTGHSDGAYSMSTTLVARTPPASLKLPPPLIEQPVVSMSLVNGYATLQATWSAQPDAVGYVFNGPGWNGQISPGAFAMTGMFEIPDMSMVPGWDPTLGIAPGLPNNGPRWSVLAVHGGSLAELIQPVPSTGITIETVGWTGRAQ